MCFIIFDIISTFLKKSVLHNVHQTKLVEKRREKYELMSSENTIARDRATHIYDDMHVPVPRAETDGEQIYSQANFTEKTEETCSKRISHQYEKLIGLAKKKKNRMCVFGIISLLVAIFSFTGAIIFSILYAKPTYCDTLLKGMFE